MRLLPFAAFSVAAFGAVAPALADAVTYAGTIGDKPVILELTSAPEEGDPVAGRYASMAEGIDIALRQTSDEGAPLTLAEQAPCGQDLANCPVGEDGALANPPVAALWALTPSAGALSGTWTDAASGQTLPIALERRATRPLEISEGMLADALTPDNVASDVGPFRVLDPAAFPYDFLKLGVASVPGEETKADGAVVRMDADARLGLAYPSVVTLGGPEIGPVNAFLRQQRLQLEMSVFTCWSNTYHGLALTPEQAEEMKTATEVSATLDRVSPQLIGYYESGSPYCGGAHPNNFLTHRLVDARTGMPLVPESLLADWVPRGRDGTAVDPASYDNSDDTLTLGPSDELVAFVKNGRERFEADREAECGYDDLIANALGVYFTQDALVFTLRDVGSAGFACTDDLMTVPLAEATALLSADAFAYFPALK